VKGGISVDLVKAADYIAKNPYAPLIILMLVLWYAGWLLLRKDNFIEKHFKDDLKNERNEKKWLQERMWEMMQERGDSFDEENQNPPDSYSDDHHMPNSRRKLSKSKGR
jgi:hypothetical protein